jgi:hypothetical protein
MITSNSINKELHGNAKESLNDFLLFQRVFFSFKKFIPSGVSLTNRHLLIINGHGNHVTLKAIEQAQEGGLNMISWPSHTSHVLQPIIVSCFKPFQITFRRAKDAIMSKSNHMD